jgi:hypothetical protein
MRLLDSNVIITYFIVLAVLLTAGLITHFYKPPPEDR